MFEFENQNIVRRFKLLTLFFILLMRMSSATFSQEGSVSLVEIEIPSLSLTDFTREGEFSVSEDKVYRCVFKHKAEYYVEQFDLKQKEYTKLDVILPSELQVHLNSLIRYIFYMPLIVISSMLVSLPRI